MTDYHGPIKSVGSRKKPRPDKTRWQPPPPPRRDIQLPESWLRPLKRRNTPPQDLKPRDDLAR
jgi:hypothetical protein